MYTSSTKQIHFKFIQGMQERKKPLKKINKNNIEQQVIWMFDQVDYVDRDFWVE